MSSSSEDDEVLTVCQACRGRYWCNVHEKDPRRTSFCGDCRRKPQPVPAVTAEIPIGEPQACNLGPIELGNAVCVAASHAAMLSRCLDALAGSADRNKFRPFVGLAGYVVTGGVTAPDGAELPPPADGNAWHFDELGRPVEKPDLG